MYLVKFINFPLTGIFLILNASTCDATKITYYILIRLKLSRQIQILNYIKTVLTILWWAELIFYSHFTKQVRLIHLEVFSLLNLQSAILKMVFKNHAETRTLNFIENCVVSISNSTSLQYISVR